MSISKVLTYVIDKLSFPIRENGVFFLMMYALGIIVTYATLPDWQGAKIYENVFFELFFDLLAVCLLLCLLPRKVRLRVRRIVYVVAYSLAIIDVFCFAKFESTISPSMLLLVAETTGSETSEFFETYLTYEIIYTPVMWVLLLLLFHSVSVSLWKHRRALAKRLQWDVEPLKALKDRLTAPCAQFATNTFVVVLAIVMLVMGWEPTMENKSLLHRLATCKTIGDVERTFNLKPKPELYQPVYRLAYGLQCNYLISLQLDRMRENTEGVKVDSCSFLSRNIVLIIGESYNKYHSQLYGYEKNTTPYQVEMEKTGRLTKWNDVIAPWNLTSFVFKHMMTTYCYGDDGDWCDYPLFCQLFREAGYDVRFLTNQFINHAKDAVFDFSGGFFINDDVLSKAQFDVRNEQTHLWDEDLLKDYERLAAPRDSSLYAEGKGTLSVFHLIGQHVSYRIRCPRKKHHFFTSDYDMPHNTPREKKNMAYYDCAVWYNDSVVNAIVDRFKDDDAIIIYLPDHGEEVYGPGSLHSCGRKHTTAITRNIAQQEYEIPMWVYCTEKYAAAHPQVVEAVKAARNKPFMTDALSHVLLGLAGIKTEHYKAKYDILSPQFDAKRPRYMQHAVDYNELMRGNPSQPLSPALPRVGGSR